MSNDPETLTELRGVTPVTEDYRPRVLAMVESDIGSGWELIYRYVVVFVVAVFITISTNDMSQLFWVGAFFATNGTYTLLLNYQAPVVTRNQYYLLTALLCASITFYTGWAIVLFAAQGVTGITVAIAAICGMAAFNMSRHRLGTLNAIWAVTHAVMAIAYFGVAILFRFELSFADSVLVLLTTLGACGYLAVAHYRTMMVYEDLNRRRAEAVQTQKMRAVGQLTAGVAHDFNNLLTVIRGNIELAELAEGAEQRQAFGEAKAAADRAAMLTSQLLSFSRRARLQAAPVEVAGFWQTFNMLLSRTLPANVTVKLMTDPALEWLYCDRNQLENAVLNLVINARDAMEGQGKIYLISRPATPDEALELPDGDTRAFGLIEVRDTGPGIPARHMDVVTEPFFTTKGPGEGSGMGLSMAKGFSEQSGGGLFIDSDSSGTRVQLILPIAAR